MYKNANSSFHHLKAAKAVQQQHSITLSRINHSAQRIGKMVHVFTPPNADEIDVAVPVPEQLTDPTNTARTMNKIISESIEKSASPPRSYDFSSRDDLTSLSVECGTNSTGTLNLERIQKLMEKVSDAEKSSIPEWEKQQQKIEQSLKKSNHTKIITDSTVIMLLEKQLISSIKRYYDRNTTGIKHITLSARILLPYYKISDVTHFLEVFQRVDTDLR
jgi:hypothetical protein